MDRTKATGSKLGALPVMLGAVALQVIAVVVLKSLADGASLDNLAFVGAGISVVFVLNVLRLFVWGYAHQHFPLSNTFPLSSLFFPCILAVATVFGDPIETRQVIGAALITIGSVWLNWRSES